MTTPADNIEFDAAAKLLADVEFVQRAGTENEAGAGSPERRYGVVTLREDRCRLPNTGGLDAPETESAVLLFDGNLGPKARGEFPGHCAVVDCKISVTIKINSSKIRYILAQHERVL